MHVFNTVLPVFLLIAVGIVLHRTEFLPAELVKISNKLVYFIALPALLFLKMATNHTDFGGRLDLLAALAGTMLTMAILAWKVAQWARLHRRDRGTFTQAALRCNAAFVGLPVVAYAISNSLADIPRLVILLLSLIVILNNLFSVIILLLSAERKAGITMAFSVIFKTLLNPLILSSALGLLYSMHFKTIPLPIERTLAALGNMALPLALIGVGATIRFRNINRRTIWAAALLKTLISPFLAYAFALLFGLSSQETLPLVIFMAGPTAAASYILVDQIGGDREMAAGAVALSTILSFFSLTVAVMWFA